jgi:hypothetical protein
VKIKNIYSKIDFIVPGSSGKGTNPKHTYFFVHPLVQFWPPIIKEIKEFLEE